VWPAEQSLGHDRGLLRVNATQSNSYATVSTMVTARAVK
jgi:hypothetical protein